MTIPVVVNLVNSVIALFIGVYCTIVPRKAAESLGIDFVHPSGLTDFRATYGGLCLAFGLFFAAPLFKLVDLKSSLILGTLFYICLATVRLGGILFDGPQKSILYVFLVTEIAFTVACIWSIRELQ